MCTVQGPIPPVPPHPATKPRMDVPQRIGGSSKSGLRQATPARTSSQVSRIGICSFYHLGPRHSSLGRCTFTVSLQALTERSHEANAFLPSELIRTQIRRSEAACAGPQVLSAALRTAEEVGVYLHKPRGQAHLRGMRLYSVPEAVLLTCLAVHCWPPWPHATLVPDFVPARPPEQAGGHCPAGCCSLIRHSGQVRTFVRVLSGSVVVHLAAIAVMALSSKNKSQCTHVCEKEHLIPDDRRALASGVSPNATAVVSYSTKLHTTEGTTACNCLHRSHSCSSSVVASSMHTSSQDVWAAKAYVCREAVGRGWAAMGDEHRENLRI